MVWHFLDGPTANSNSFQRLFWAFAPFIEGFQFCHLVISIDVTHLYGKYWYMTLVAVGVGANVQLFPLAFTIMKGENDSRGLFMACI